MPRSSSQMVSSVTELIEAVSDSTMNMGWHWVGLLFLEAIVRAGDEAFDISSSIVSYTDEREA